MTNVGTQLMILEWVLIAITLYLVYFILEYRFYKRDSRSLLASDYFVLFGWLSFLVNVCLDTATYGIGAYKKEGPPEDMAMTLTKLYFVEGILYLNTMYFLKIAILAQFETMVPAFMTKTRLALRITWIAVALGWSSELIGNIFWCLPIYKTWDTSVCSARGTVIIWYIQTVPHVATDFMVYLLPMPTLLGLAKSSRQIMELIVLVIVGITCVLFAILNTISTVTDSHLGLFTFSIEQASAIIVVCLPAFRHIFCSLPHKSMKMRGLPSTSANTTASETSLTVASEHEAKSIV